MEIVRKPARDRSSGVACEMRALRDLVGRGDVWRTLYASPRPTMADMVVNSAQGDTIASLYLQFSRSDLTAAADVAPYRAKHAGRNRFHASPRAHG